jgi:hypothetical protein
MENLELLKWGTEQCKNTSGTMQKHERTSHHKASNHCRRSIWFSRLLLAVACRVRSVAQRGARGKERVGSAHAQRSGARGGGRERLLCVCLRVCARVHARAHTDTRARRRVAPTPINPGSRSWRPPGPHGAGQTCRLRRPGQPSAHHRALTKRASSRMPDSSVPRPSLSPVCFCSCQRFLTCAHAPDI